MVSCRISNVKHTGLCTAIILVYDTSSNDIISMNLLFYYGNDNRNPLFLIENTCSMSIFSRKTEGIVSHFSSEKEGLWFADVGQARIALSPWNTWFRAAFPLWNRWLHASQCVLKLERKTFSCWRSSFGIAETSITKCVAQAHDFQDAYVYVGTWWMAQIHRETQWIASSSALHGYDMRILVEAQEK